MERLRLLLLGNIQLGDPQRFNKDILVSTFSKLPYKILWKFEQPFPELPENVMIQEWLPQQEILGKYQYWIKL